MTARAYPTGFSRWIALKIQPAQPQKAQNSSHNRRRAGGPAATPAGPGCGWLTGFIKRCCSSGYLLLAYARGQSKSRTLRLIGRMHNAESGLAELCGYEEGFRATKRR